LIDYHFVDSGGVMLIRMHKSNESYLINFMSAVPVTWTPGTGKVNMYMLLIRYLCVLIFICTVAELGCWGALVQTFRDGPLLT